MVLLDSFNHLFAMGRVVRTARTVQSAGGKFVTVSSYCKVWYPPDAWNVPFDVHDRREEVLGGFVLPAGPHVQADVYGCITKTCPMLFYLRVVVKCFGCGACGTFAMASHRMQ